MRFSPNISALHCSEGSMKMPETVDETEIATDNIRSAYPSACSIHTFQQRKHPIKQPNQTHMAVQTKNIAAHNRINKLHKLHKQALLLTSPMAIAETKTPFNSETSVGTAG